jgi:hypothetical protein
MAKKHKRKRLLVDSAFQFRLLTRMVCYLLLWIIIVFHVSFLFQLGAKAAAGEGLGSGAMGLYEDYLYQQKPVFISLILITPLFLHDLLKFSHRLAGPLYRCRQLMREMAAGKSVPPFKPRKQDLMPELFQSFNALISAWNARIDAGTNGKPVEQECPELTTEKLDLATPCTAVADRHEVAV